MPSSKGHEIAANEIPRPAAAAAAADDDDDAALAANAAEKVDPGPAAPITGSSSTSGMRFTSLTRIFCRGIPYRSQSGPRSHGQRKPPARILNLPAELIDNIFSHLSAFDLAAVGATCTTLREHSLVDKHWHRCVQENVPGVKVVSPGPCTNYRHLFLLHERLWFLPRFKIWFSDRDLAGKLIIARFDPRRGCIEAFQLVGVSEHGVLEAVTTPGATNPWTAIPPAGLLPDAVGILASDAELNTNQDALFTSFQPRLRLHLDKPVLQFRGRAQDGQVDEFCHSKRAQRNRYADEIPMALEDRAVGMFSNFLLARPLPPREAARRIAAKSATDNVWPPPAIPAPHRVAGARPGQATVILSLRDRPDRRSHVSDQAFRIRQWIELAGTPSSPVHMRHGPGHAGTPIYQDTGGGDGDGDGDHDQEQHDSTPERRQTRRRSRRLFSDSGSSAGSSRAAAPPPVNTGVHIAEEVSTFATLDPALYTPTALRPWRGIWVSCYAGHGCEFLLVHQPEAPPATDAQLGIARSEWDSDDEWEARRASARIYSGRLEAIKLTGDPNIPRGEHTFIAEDLGPGGQVGVLDEGPFAGCRLIRSRGHIAAMGFLRDKYIESRLVLVSPDRLAVYWIDLGHMSFFERVDIDSFLKP